MSRNLARLASTLAPKVAILMYHRVSRPGEDPWNLVVAPDHFTSQLRHLKKHYEVVRLNEIPGLLRDRTLPRRAVILTFDDGYRDNLTTAVPILEDMRLPATFFISTGSTNSNREFWWDELARLVLSAPDSAGPVSVPGAEPSHQRATWPTGNEEERQRTHQALYNRLLPLEFEAQEFLLSAVRAWALHDSGPSSDSLPMTLDELRDLAASPASDIGAHSVHHPPLDRLEPAAQLQEIRESRRQLQTWVEKPIVAFSYPYGYYNRETVQAVAQDGFEMAVTCREMAVQYGDPLLELGRFPVHDWDEATFDRQLARFFWRQSSRYD